MNIPHPEESPEWEDALEFWLDGALEDPARQQIEERLLASPAARDHLLRLLAARGLMEWVIGAGAEGAADRECESIRASFDRYRRGRLAAGKVGRLSRHLHACVACQARYRAFEHHSTTRSRPARQGPRRLGRAAALALGLLFCGLLLQPGGPSLEGDAPLAARDTAWPAIPGTAEALAGMRGILGANRESESDPAGRLMIHLEESWPDFVSELEECAGARALRGPLFDELSRYRQRRILSLACFIMDPAFADTDKVHAAYLLRAADDRLPDGPGTKAFWSGVMTRAHDDSLFLEAFRGAWFASGFVPWSAPWLERQLDLAVARGLCQSTVTILRTGLGLEDDALRATTCRALRGRLLPLSEEQLQQLARFAVPALYPRPEWRERLVAIAERGDSPLARASVLCALLLADGPAQDGRRSAWRKDLLALHIEQDVQVRLAVARYLQETGEKADLPVAECMLGSCQGVPKDELSDEELQLRGRLQAVLGHR